MTCKNYFQCCVCGKFTDDGDSLYYICLDCIDNIYESRCKNESSENSENQQAQD